MTITMSSVGFIETEAIGNLRSAVIGQKSRGVRTADTQFLLGESQAAGKIAHSKDEN